MVGFKLVLRFAQVDKHFLLSGIHRFQKWITLTHPFKNAGDDIGEQLIVEVISIYDGFIGQDLPVLKNRGQGFL